MNYLVYYILNDNTIEDWTLHTSLASAIDQSYYWLHHTRLDRCRIYRVEGRGARSEVAEIHNV